MLHPDATRGPFQPLLEPGVAVFARWYVTQLERHARRPAEPQPPTEDDTES